VYREWCLLIEGDVGMSIMTQKVLLDSYVQPLILSNASMDGLKLTNVHFKPCMYQILTSMGRLKKVSKVN
jgi:hypothetical protein